MREDDRARWTKLVADFESADLSQREFAQERGISLSNLRYWICRLRKESRPLVTEAQGRSDQAPDRAAMPEGSRLAPVRVVASAPKARRAVAVVPAGDALLKLALPVGHADPVSGGHRPRLPPGPCGRAVCRASVRIFIGSTPIDMRKSIDGLLAIVQDELAKDAYSGHLFVFVSRLCDRVKILTWDKGGFVLVKKRLDGPRRDCLQWLTRTAALRRLRLGPMPIG